MRLSEYLLLGSTMVMPSRGVFYSPVGQETFGCALGMIAVGKDGRRGTLNEQAMAFYELNRRLANTFIECDQIPCGCCLGEESHTLKSLIVHLFDCHYFSLSIEHWTLERIADWLEKVEPKEEVRTDIVAAEKEAVSV
jgi:hypothetical protein